MNNGIEKRLTWLELAVGLPDQAIVTLCKILQGKRVSPEERRQAQEASGVLVDFLKELVDLQ